MTNLVETIQNLILTYGLNLVWAVIIVIAGRWGAGFASNLIKKTLKRTDIDVTLTQFVSTLVYYAVLTLFRSEVSPCQMK